MKTSFILATFLIVGPAWATQPPDPGTLDAYKKDGSYAKRLDFVKQVGNHRVRPDVAQRTWARLRRLHGGVEPKEPLPRWKGMPTKGTNNVLVLLIDFPDYPHVNDASTVTDKLFGDGVPAEYPRESLRRYYERSSYNQLHIRGHALGWYRMQHNRSWYTTTYPDHNTANRAVMLEVIQHFDATHDFAQYDNNGDGKVDYFAIIWSGPDNGWGNFWWGYQWRLFNPITADGVQFESFSWQWESRPVGHPFEAGTIIHETGHALGLPDYYDYTPNQGPEGGVGGLDMMHGNFADHNAFSKFMLEWLTPKAISAGQSNVTLRALAQHPDAVAVMPGYTGATPYQEYFLVENRQRMNNDTGNPGDGLLIWHVDATANSKGEDFLYNNSDTGHKLLRLMEADGLEEIETGDGKADAGDYYTQGRSFSPTTNPNSRAYDGSDTQVTVQDISAGGVSMTLACSVQGAQVGPRITRSPGTLQQTVAEGANATAQSFQVSASGATLGYAISDNAAWLSVSPASGSSSGAANTHTVTYASADLPPGLYSATITITAPDAENSPQSLGVTLTVQGNQIARAVDATNLVWNILGTSQWFEQTTVTHDGQDAAQSGPIGDNQSNAIETTLAGPGMLSFWWKASSEEGYDFLLLFLDGVERPERLSGYTEWQSVNVPIPAGTHTVRWTYSKDGSLSGYADAAWVDQVTFTPGSLPAELVCVPESLAAIASQGQAVPEQTLLISNGGGGAMNYTLSDNAAWLAVTPAEETSSGAPNQHSVSFNSTGLAPGTYSAEITISAPGAAGSPKIVAVTFWILAGGASLAEAVDFPSSPWTTGGDMPWEAQAGITHDGTDAVASGFLFDNETSWIETTVQGPGTLSFWWKVSSEPNYDFLVFLLDGVESGLAISGEVPWRQQFVPVPAGSHTVRWMYAKDDSWFEGWDAGWLDQVNFTSGGVPERETLLSATFDAGLPQGWLVVDYAGEGAEWAFNDPGDRGNLTGGSGGFAIADSDHAGFVRMATDLIAPPIDCTGYTNVMLEFKTELFMSGTEVAEVDLRVNGGAWTAIWSESRTMPGPQTVSLPLPQADGQPDVVISFYYYDAVFDWWWQVDDVRVTARPVPPPARGLLTEWRQAWEDFDRNYSYFGHKGIDWAPVYAAHTNAFAQIQDGAQFAVQLNNALQLLHDWHVAVKKPDGTWLGYAGSYTNNYPALLLTNYTGGQPYHDVKGAHALYHAWTASDLAHVVVETLDSAAFAPIADADIEAVFNTYRNAAGMILDLRANSGGSESNALRIASRFTDLPVTYGYTRTRISGNDHNAFTAFAPKTLTPSTGTRFHKPVMCLIGQRCMSSAEWFALMMKACPGVTLLGDRTRGATGNPAEFSLPALDVSYLVSRWIGYSAEQRPFEDVGILPAIAIPPGPASYDDAARRDYVLERAIELLKQPRLAINRLQTGGVTIAWPADMFSRYTLLRTTNLLHPQWSLAPGSISNRLGSGGLMIYTNPQPNLPIDLYRLQIGK